MRPGVTRSPAAGEGWWSRVSCSGGGASGSRLLRGEVDLPLQGPRVLGARGGAGGLLGHHRRGQVQRRALRGRVVHVEQVPDLVVDQHPPVVGQRPLPGVRGRAPAVGVERDHRPVLARVRPVGVHGQAQLVDLVGLAQHDAVGGVGVVEGEHEAGPLPPAGVAQDVGHGVPERGGGHATSVTCETTRRGTGVPAASASVGVVAVGAGGPTSPVGSGAGETSGSVGRPRAGAEAGADDAGEGDGGSTSVAGDAVQAAAPRATATSQRCLIRPPRRGPSPSSAARRRASRPAGGRAWRGPSPG